MKIAVSSTGKNLDSPIDPRFGRCAYFVIVETEDMSYEAFENENNALSGGAGIQSAGFLSSKNVMAVMTGNCGPNAIKALSAGRINVYTGQTGTVREAILTYQKGGLIPSTQATVDEKSGMSGTGPGMGRGYGRGMGMGRGRGMGMRLTGGVQGRGPDHSDPLEKDSLTALKQEAEDLQNHLKEIQMKIKKLEQTST